MEFTVTELNNFEINDDGLPFLQQSDNTIDTLNFEANDDGLPFFGVNSGEAPVSTTKFSIISRIF